MLNHVSVLTPERVLPGEGAEAPEIPTRNGSPTQGELLQSLMGMIPGGGHRFTVTLRGIAMEDDGETESILRHLHVRPRPDDAKTPWLDLTPSYCCLSLTELVTGLNARLKNMEGLVSLGDVLRLFLQGLTGHAQQATRAYLGKAVPLVRWSRFEDGEEEAGKVDFVGVWMADEDGTATLGDSLSVWSADSESDSVQVVLEDADVEGRGLKEVVATVALLGVVFGGAQSADAGFLFFKNKKKEQKRVAKAHHYRQKAMKVNRSVLARAGEEPTRVVIDVRDQRAYLLVGGKVAVDSPVSTARPGKHTPRGEFKITQKVRTGKISTIYDCPLPYWMRLDQSAIGLHVGDLPGYAASAGCVRLSWDGAKVIFDNCKSGTSVQIVDDWQGMQVAQAY